MLSSVLFQRIVKTVILLAFSIILITSSTGVGTATVIESREYADWHPGDYPSAWYVTAELREVELKIQDHQIWRETGFSTEFNGPDYLVIIYFNHSGHEIIKGTAWTENSNLFSPAIGVPRENFERQTLFNYWGGVNEFDGYDRGAQDTGPFDLPNLPENRFLMVSSEGYTHLHCGPKQNMTVRVAVYDIDEDPKRDVAESAIAGAIGKGAELATKAIPQTGGVGIPGTSVAVSLFVKKLVDSGGDADLIGHGEGVLNPQGMTEIPLTFESWINSNSLRIPCPDCNPGSELDIGDELKSQQIAGAHNDGTVIDKWIVPPRLEDILDHREHDRYFIQEQRGHITFETRSKLVYPGSGIFTDVNPDRIGDQKPGEAPLICGLIGHSGLPGDSYKSFGSAIRLSDELRNEGIPLDQVPDRFRGFVKNQRANVQIGAEKVGIAVNDKGKATNVVLGGFNDPSLLVSMSPETADELVYADNKASLVQQKISNGDITYEGVSIGDKVFVEASRLGLVGYKAYNHISIRVASILPTQYDLAQGSKKEIIHNGKHVTLRRNELGYRVISSNKKVMQVVSRTGTQVGITIQGSQRMIVADSPPNWEKMSKSAGVYSDQINTLTFASSRGDLP